MQICKSANLQIKELYIYLIIKYSKIEIWFKIDFYDFLSKKFKQLIILNSYK